MRTPALRLPPAWAFFIALALAALTASPGICQDQTFASRDLAIDLGEISTDARLTIPAAENGTYPAVLIVQGGPADMDGYIPSQATGLDEPSRPLLQIGEYLSERGFLVLRYNERGIGTGGTVLNGSAVDNITFDQLQGDANRALDALLAEPEADSGDVTVMGYGEGTMTTVRLAEERPEVDRIVLLAPFAGEFIDVVRFQMVTRPISYAEEEMDGNGDGLLTVEEMVATIGRDGESLAPLQGGMFVEGINGSYQWYPGLDVNGDGSVSIQGELRPIFERDLDAYTSDPAFPGYSWLQSVAGEKTNMDAMGGLDTSVLILHGEDDAQIPVEEALLLEQRLTASRHPDHTLITYPGLGHSFYPARGWIEPLGPIQNQVLSDLHSWLKDPDRRTGAEEMASRPSSSWASPLSQDEPEPVTAGETVDEAAGETEVEQPGPGGEGEGVIDRITQIGSDLRRRADEGLQDARDVVGGFNLSNLSTNLSMNLSSFNISTPNLNFNASSWLGGMNASVLPGLQNISIQG